MTNLRLAREAAINCDHIGERKIAKHDLRSAGSREGPPLDDHGKRMSWAPHDARSQTPIHFVWRGRLASVNEYRHIDKAVAAAKALALNVTDILGHD